MINDEMATGQVQCPRSQEAAFFVDKDKCNAEMSWPTSLVLQM